MMKYSAAVVLGIIAFACTEKKTAPDHKIAIGVMDSLHSTILNENRKIWVYQPADLKPDEKCPVVYLLDGDWHFHSVSGMIDQLVGNSLMPRTILIAIPNTDRSRDLTPTNSLELPDGSKPDFLKSTGGGENFTKFIETELMPWVESKYHTAPYKILVGHSFGGLFAINTLVHHPKLFNAYVSIDPSMWWDDRKLLGQTDSALQAGDFSGRTLYMSMANTMIKGMDTVRVAADTASTHNHIRSIIALGKLISRKTKNGLNAQWKYYDKDDHGSVPFISEYDAFRFIFDYYKLPGDFNDATPETYTEHFKMISSRLGYEVLPPQSDIGDICYYYIREKKLDKAQAFLDLNAKNYPGSPGVLRYQGDIFVSKGDTAKAIDFYNQSLAKRDDPEVKGKIEALKKK